MGVWREGKGWCFCGSGRSERLKGSIFSGKGPAMASISCGGDQGEGTGFLIHPNLLLTTHGTLPSAAAAEDVEIQLNHGRHPSRLVPSRFFITSSVLDLTIVWLDVADFKSNSHCHQPYYLKTCGNSNLNLGSTVFLLSYNDKKELTIGEGKVVIATDNLIKLSAERRAWRPGSAGFDSQGNLSLMICDPMKLATSPTAKSSSASSSSSQTFKGESSMLFGIPIPIICDWLHQHWEGSLDELSKPKLPLIRLLSAGQKSEHSCPSFSHRQVFKPADQEVESIAPIPGKFKYQLGSSSSANACTNGQGISTPEIYESARITSGPLRKKENATIQLLDINFPPRAPRSIVLPLPLKQLLPEPSDNGIYDSKAENLSIDVDCCSEVQSSLFLPEVSDLISEGGRFSSSEETMYSAETMESRNIPSPTYDSKFHQVGRSQSCGNYSSWTSSQRNTTKRIGLMQQQQLQLLQHRSIPSRKAQTHAAPVAQKSHEYYSPTVSWSMKKRNSSDQPPVRPWQQNKVQLSPRIRDAGVRDRRDKRVEGRQCRNVGTRRDAHKNDDWTQGLHRNEKYKE